MASWVLAHPPWPTLARFRIRWDSLRTMGGRIEKQFLSTPTFSFDAESPAMKEIKAYPYPSAAPDHDLFEEPDTEYFEVAGGPETYATSLPRFTSQRPCSILRKLAIEGRYEDAERVYSELKALDVKIQPHPVYHFVARRALSSNNIASRDRLETFTKWWSLVPPKTEVSSGRSVGYILTEILRKDVIPDLPLIASFSLLAASKGYASYVMPHTIEVIARYAPATYTLQFLEESCVNAWNYETSLDAFKRNPHQLARKLLQHRFRAWYSYVVRAFTSVKDFGPALRATEIAISRDILITQSTYDYLLGKLEQANAKKRISTLTSLWDSCSDLRRRTRDPSLISIVAPCIHSEGIVRPSKDDIHEIGTAVRQLKQVYHGHKSIGARDVAFLMDTLLTCGRASLLGRVRSLAYRSGDAAISTWVLAEMIYYQYYKRDDVPAFLTTFERHFHLVGVPQSVFTKIFSSPHRIEFPSSPKPRGELHLLGSPPSFRRRLPPTFHHTYMLWRTMAHNIPRPAALIHMYREFLVDLLKSRKLLPSLYPLPRAIGVPRNLTNGPDPDADYLRPTTPLPSYDARFFNIFIATFGRFKFWPYMTRVILDLFHLGFRPDLSTHNTFVAMLQLKPNMYAVHRLLDYWEEAVDNMCAHINDPWEDRTTERFPELLDPQKTKSLLLNFFYLVTISRLEIDGRLQHAREVVERYQSKALDTGDEHQTVRQLRKAIKRALEHYPAPETALFDNPQLDMSLDAAPLQIRVRRRRGR